MSLLSKLFGRGTGDATQPPAPLSRDQFADHYVAMLAEKAPDLTVERVDTGIRLTWADGGTMTQFLNNAYAQYRGDPDALDPVLEAQLASARAAAEPRRLDLDLVMPLIKSRSWLDTASAQAGREVDFVLRPFVSDLIIVFAQDLEASISYVKAPDLEGVCDEAQLVDRAMSNLAKRASGLEAVGGEGRYRIELDGIFDASLILLATDWIAPLELEGDPVFAIPSRDRLMVCGGANARAVAELAEIAPQIAAGDAYDISGALLTLKDGTLQLL